MRRALLTAVLAAMGAAGCGGDDRKAVAPAGPMAPPGPGAEREGGKGKGQPPANTATEK